MNTNKFEKLKQLYELYKEGILTKDEVEQEKKKILAEDDSKTKNNITSEPSTTNQSYNNDDEDDEIKSVRKKRLIYAGIALILLIGIGVFIGLYQHRQIQIITEKEQEREQALPDTIDEMERLLETHRQDSIAEVERERMEQEEFIKNHPILISTFLTVTSDEYPYLSYNRNISKTLKALRFEKVSSSSIDYEAGTDGTSWECLKTTFRRDDISITLITQYDDINNVYNTEIEFSSDTDLNKFLKNVIKFGFTKEGYESYAYGEYTGWGIDRFQNKINIYYLP